MPSKLSKNSKLEMLPTKTGQKSYQLHITQNAPEKKKGEKKLTIFEIVIHPLSIKNIMHGGHRILQTNSTSLCQVCGCEGT